MLLDPDLQIEHAKKEFNTEDPTVEQRVKSKRNLQMKPARFFDNPELRNRLIETKILSEQIIDIVSIDEVLFTGFNEQAEESSKKC